MYLISHFLNEELLLPYWLRHHIPMFDHGIMVDYGSTDASLEIIRQLAPHWEIRRTQVQEFREPQVGQEIQQIEAELPHGSWKTVLNTTEFLVCPDLRQFVQRFDREFPSLPGFRATGVVMVDSEEEQYRPLTDDALLLQRTHGIMEQQGYRNVVTGRYGPSRCRFIHRLAAGGYRTGRHTTVYQYELSPIDEKYKPGLQIRNDWSGIHPEIFVCWFGRYCPFEAIKKRVAYFDFHIPRESFLGRQIPASPNDLSLLEQELKEVRAMRPVREWNYNKGNPCICHTFHG